MVRIFFEEQASKTFIFISGFDNEGGVLNFKLKVQIKKVIDFKT